MDIIYVDVMTVEFCRQFSGQILVKTFFHGMEGMGDGGYRFISQLEEAFYQGIQESLTISTYYITIVIGLRKKRQKQGQVDSAWQSLRLVLVSMWPL